MRILVIRFSSIGDIVLASPVFRCLKQQLPGAEVHLLTKHKFRAVTEANPYIDKFHYFSDDLGALVDKLRKVEFDAVIDLHKNFRSYRVKWALGKPSYAFRKLSLEKFLLTRLRIDRMPQRHITQRSLDAVRPLGVTDDGGGLDHFIPVTASLAGQPLPFGVGQYIALVIGASYETKKLPAERLIELCRLIDLPIVLVGGPEDKEDGERVKGLDPTRIFNACGPYDLHQSSIIVRDARLVISHDTGMQYIACAFRKKVLAIWGGTSPRLQVEPYYGHKDPVPYRNFLVEGLRCQPCSNYGMKKCPEGHFNCMKQLDLSAIASTVREWWQGS
jgi:heptosyltransferase-2